MSTFILYGLAAIGALVVLFAIACFGFLTYCDLTLRAHFDALDEEHVGS